MIWYVLVGVLVLVAAPARAANCTATSLGLAPSTYTRSAQTLADGLAAAALVEPLDANGTPSPTGKIGFLLIGMSNAQDAGKAFRDAYNGDPLKNTKTTFVNAAQSGMTASEWALASSVAWARSLTTVAQAGLTAPQVQWAHIVMTQRSPGTNGPMTAAQVQAIAVNLLTNYPNVRGVWLSGLGYQGYSTSTTSLEPYAHDDSLLMASLVGTLPIFSDFFDQWSDGVIPNPLTGMRWVCNDLKVDGVHPSISGMYRLGLLQLDAWRADPVMAWLW